MSTLKKSPTVSVKASTKVVAKPAAPVTAKRVTSKALPKKPAAAPAKPVTRAVPPKPTTKVSVAKEVKVEKVKKPKLMRDSFTIPKAEYVVIEALKERAGKLARAAKKSELLRAGIKALAAMSDANFLLALNAVPTIKTGRPSTAS
ncbi:MAG: hypothetical protein Q7U05_05465 [Polaromonas sp.]|nr:hypothetical protein [Polaromonas sp.]